MDFKKAIDLLELTQNFTENDLKKAYHLKCLQYHPDKNPNGEEMFKAITNAYQYLKTFMNTNVDDDFFSNVNDIGYDELLRIYIHSISNRYNWNCNFIVDTLYSIIGECQKLSLKLFESLDKNTAMKIYSYINKYHYIFHLQSDILTKMKDIVERKNEGENVILLRPRFSDIYINNILKLERDDDVFYIPSWHNEVYFKKDIVVKIHPELPSHVYIDDGNNTHISISTTLFSLFHREKLEVDIDSIKFQVNVSDIYLRKVQRIVLSGQGISKIKENDIFNIEDKSDVIITLTLT